MSGRMGGGTAYGSTGSYAGTGAYASTGSYAGTGAAGSGAAAAGVSTGTASSTISPYLLYGMIALGAIIVLRPSK